MPQAWRNCGQSVPKSADAIIAGGSPASSVPAISVIVPLFNVATYAAAAVESLLAQEFGDFEAILVDDGSEDGSGEIALAATGGDPRFHLIRQVNQGLSAARNVGLDRARGTFIAFLDGDDRFAPGFLSRMHAALREEGGDWVACAVADCWPDGRRQTHAALFHGAAPEHVCRFPLSTWSVILAHYPSVWNKLYRREVLQGLRFDEGTWFEDHAFFQRFALRTDGLLYLPEPLYEQTRGRDGQITASDDDRIFDQFTVLDRLHGIMMASALPDAEEAYGDLACRLLAERQPVLRDAGRRARWLAEARRWLAEHGLVFRPEASPSLAAVLSGACPVGVVLDLTSGREASRAVVDALSAQDIAGFEVLVVTRAAKAGARDVAALQAACPGRHIHRIVVPSGGAPAVWRAALAATGARALVLAGPDDGFEPVALRLWADAMGRAGADLAVSGMRAAADEGWHDGWGDPRQMTGPLAEGQVLRPRPGAQPFHPLTAAKLISLPALAAALPPEESPVPQAALMAGLARTGSSAVWLDFPGARPGLRPPPALAELERGLAALSAGDPALQRQLLIREIRMAFDFCFDRRHWRGQMAALVFLLKARMRLLWMGAGRRAGPLDPGLGRNFLRVLGVRPEG